MFGDPAANPKIDVVPAEPRIACVAVHVRAGNDTDTRISTALSKRAAHRFAAYRNASSRCCPTVVPVLPPTGAAGVGSLKPTPAGSVGVIVTVEAANAGVAAVSSAMPRAAARRGERRRRMIISPPALAPH